jgi:AdoMet-dependent heme synthase
MPMEHPFLISWNLTERCNLRCPHCYLDATQLDGGQEDISPADALDIVDQIAGYCPGAMLILTGGEPLLRPDFWQIAQRAADKGLATVLGSNGTLLTPEIIERLIEVGVQGVGVSLDSVDPVAHDRFRGQEGSWQKTVNAIDTMARVGLEFQIQFTVSKNNYDQVPQLIAMAAEKGAKAANIFFLVCTGRGQQMTDITPAQYESMLTYLAKAEKTYEERLMVRARCAPHFLRIVDQENPDSAIMRGTTSGCIAGTGYFRITPKGEVTPCPYMPEAVGDLKKQSLKEIWEQDAVMQSLRKPEYHGKCQICSYQEACGGCRARALSASGDMMGEDPWCEYIPPPIPENPLAPKTDNKPVWDDAARERLAKVPIFLRSMVKSGVERYARKKGLSIITPNLMQEMRSYVGKGKPR